MIYLFPTVAARSDPGLAIPHSHRHGRRIPRGLDQRPIPEQPGSGRRGLEATDLLFYPSPDLRAGKLLISAILHSFAAGLAELVTASKKRFSMTQLEVEVVLSGRIFIESPLTRGVKNDIL